MGICKITLSYLPVITSTYIRTSQALSLNVCIFLCVHDGVSLFGFIVGYSSSQQFESCNQLFAKNRMEGLGPVVQHRIIAGTYFLSYR